MNYKYTQDIILDLNTNSPYIVVGAKQGDNNTRQIRATILENGIPINIVQDLGVTADTIYYRIHRPDHTATQKNITAIENNKIVITFTDDDLAVAGRNFIDIEFTEEVQNENDETDLHILSTVTFILDVQARPNMSQIASSPNVNFLEKLYNEASPGIDALLAAKDSAEYVQTVASAALDSLSAAAEAAQAAAEVVLESISQDYNVMNDKVDDLKDALVTPTETGTTASQDYAVGDYFWYDGNLYRARYTITTDDTIDYGTTAEICGAADEIARLYKTEDITVNALHNLVYYWYDNPVDKESTTTFVGKIIRNGTRILLNGSCPSNSTTAKLVATTPNMVIIVGSPSSVARQFPIPFIDGHTYRARLHVISGTSTQRVYPIFHKTNAIAALGSDSVDPLTGDEIRDFTFVSADYPDGIALSVSIYRKNSGNVLTNFLFDLTVEDITDGAAGQELLNIAPAELETATAAHTVGDLLVYKRQLYETTAAIAVGETLVPGTNIVPTTVKSELAEANVQADWNADTGDAAILNKPYSTTETWDLIFNDDVTAESSGSNYQTSTQISDLTAKIKVTFNNVDYIITSQPLFSSYGSYGIQYGDVDSTTGEVDFTRYPIFIYKTGAESYYKIISSLQNYNLKITTYNPYGNVYPTEEFQAAVNSVVKVDYTLTEYGVPADGRATGQEIETMRTKINNLADERDPETMITQILFTQNGTLSNTNDLLKINHGLISITFDDSYRTNYHQHFISGTLSSTSGTNARLAYVTPPTTALKSITNLQNLNYVTAYIDSTVTSDNDLQLVLYWTLFEDNTVTKLGYQTIKLTEPHGQITYKTLKLNIPEEANTYVMSIYNSNASNVAGKRATVRIKFHYLPEIAESGGSSTASNMVVVNLKDLDWTYAGAGTNIFDARVPFYYDASDSSSVLECNMSGYNIYNGPYYLDDLIDDSASKIIALDETVVSIKDTAAAALSTSGTDFKNSLPYGAAIRYTYKFVTDID